MGTIRINTEQVRETGRRLIAEGERLAEIGHELQRATGGLDTWAWDGNSRSRAEPLLNRTRPESERVKHQLEELGYKLVRVANIFEQEDNTAARNLDGMPWVDFNAGSGSVLGIATAAMATPTIMLASLPLTGDYALDLSKMSWADRLAYAEDLPGQTQALERAQEELKTSIADTDQAIDGLDKQIAELQAQRNALQEDADDFWNKLKPDGLEWGFDDGVIDAPWRTKSDAMEDQIADLDRQIQELQDQKADLDQKRQGYQKRLGNVNQQLDTLRQNQTELTAIIDAGIPSDGPTKPDWLRNQLGGCTHYIATKRDVSVWPNAKGNPGHPGHAYKWNDQAQQAGYEVGNRPVKGSIVVWEGGSGWYDKTGHDCGHVAYVEWVDPNDPNHFRVTEASVVTDSVGNAIRGTHTAPTTRDVYLDQEQGLSFVYDQTSSEEYVV